MLEQIKNETSEICDDHEKYGIFVLVLMSHGEVDDVIYGVDGNYFKLEDVYELLAPTSFPEMMDKPKLVIVQACGGGMVGKMIAFMH